MKEQLIKALQDEPDVLFAYLFGSQARKDALPTSDIDVAVYLNSKDFFKRKLELIEKLSRATKKEVDLTVLNEASPLLKFVVLSEGELIYEADRSKRLDFDLQATNEYYDFKPYMEMYNKALFKK
jgi:uncharacterized protein